MMSPPKIEHKRKHVTANANITTGEDTKPECRNVGRNVISLSYVHKFLQTRVALYYVRF